MSRYRFELAGADADDDLRRVIANTPMPGDVALTFCREPSYFAAAGVEGFASQVVACRDLSVGKIIGFGCRSLRNVFVNGQVATVGYLSSLRLLQGHRNLGLLARGYRFFRDLHRDGRASLYLTTISEGNEPAQKILTSGRAGLPAYHAAGTYRTHVMPVRSSLPHRNGGSVQVRPATDADIPAIVDFLREWGPRRQFFPSYSQADFQTLSGALFGLRADDVLLATHNGTLVGTLAGWDQSGFRQTVVHGYAGATRWLRPFYNVFAHFMGRPRLPRSGEPIRYLTAALPVIARDDLAVLDALVTDLLLRARTGPWDYVAFGVAADDPLAGVYDGYQGIRYSTRIYHVAWPDGDEFRARLDARPTYLELGSL